MYNNCRILYSKNKGNRMKITKRSALLIVFFSMLTMKFDAKQAIKNLETPIYLNEKVMQNDSADDVFNTLITHGHVVVDFYSDGCGPCKRLGPIIDDLAKTFPKITFIKVDINTFRVLAQRYYVKAVPTLIFFKNGKEVRRTVGFQSKREIIEIVKTVY